MRPAADFNAAADGDALRAAMKGFGTDEQAIIDILCARSNAQRQQISTYFTAEYGRDLIADLKSELGGKFEDVIVGLMLPADRYQCKQLHRAMDGIGTNESTLIEVLCTKSNEEVGRLVREYEDCEYIDARVCMCVYKCVYVDGIVSELLNICIIWCKWKYYFLSINLRLSW